MADALVNMEASDVFSLGGNFIAQSAVSNTERSHAKMKKANGDYEKFSTTFGVIENITVVYKFNADTGLGAALPDIGEISNAYIITSVEVSTTFDDYPEISIEGHQHGENAHSVEGNKYAIPADMITILTGAVGAYDFSALASDPTCVQTSTYSIGTNHIDAECGTGDHWVGTSIEGLESMSVNYIGLNATFAVAGWTVTSYTYDDSNDAFDTSSLNAERLVLRA